MLPTLSLLPFMAYGACDNNTVDPGTNTESEGPSCPEATSIRIIMSQGHSPLQLALVPLVC